MIEDILERGTQISPEEMNEYDAEEEQRRATRTGHQRARSSRKHGLGKRKRKRRFVDLVRVNVTAGNGGKGCASFEHSRDGRKRMPSGGNGGAGGNVLVRASDAIQSFAFQTFHFKADSGTNGSSSLMHGRKGSDLIVQVPLGTTVRELLHGEPVEGREVDLVEVGQTELLARGGAGGLGNRVFTSGMSRQAVMSTYGKRGQKKVFEMELKTIADVGLVGFPNAGKSSFLGAVSKAAPKVASYPFTTLTPMVGIADIPDKEMNQVSIADIPGLIEGAHANRGLGHEFLRHIERTKVLMYVVDAAGLEKGRDPVEDLLTLQREVQLFSYDMFLRPSLVLANKTDRKPVTCRKNLERLRRETDMPVIPCSVLKKKHLDDALVACFSLVKHGAMYQYPTDSGHQPL